MSTAEITAISQYLTFRLDKEIFAADVARVQEVLEFSEITKIPQTPRFMPGVINVRGSVVPIVNMRIKFGMAEAEKTVDTCIIVMEVSLDGETVILGAMVDSVQEVIELEPELIEPPPNIGTHIDTEFIKGMGKYNNQFIIMLNTDKVFTHQELSVVKETEELMSTGKEKGSSGK